MKTDGPIFGMMESQKSRTNWTKNAVDAMDKVIAQKQYEYNKDLKGYVLMEAALVSNPILNEFSSGALKEKLNETLNPGASAGRNKRECCCFSIGTKV